MAAASTAGLSSTTHGGQEDTSLEQVQVFESLHKNYVAIINPNTGRAMLHLKKHG